MRFIDKSIQKLAEVIKISYIQAESAGRDGIFQNLDPRVKVVFLLYVIIVISLVKSIYAELVIAVFLFMLTAVSRLNIPRFYRRIFLLAFFFGFLIPLPSALNVITRGEIIIPLASPGEAHRFWIYEIPGEIGITREGLFGVCMITLRVMNSIAASFLVMHTTPFFEMLRGMKILRVPDALLMVIILSYKYIFILSKTVEDMYLAMKCRMVGRIQRAEVRRIVAGRIFFIFNASRVRYEETYRAMQGRGFSGDIRLISYRKINGADMVALFLFIAAGTVLMVMAATGVI